MKGDVEIKKLRGEELQNASWEDAKAFCEAQEREMFETAKRNGGYWCSNMAALDDHRRYVEHRLNEHDFTIARLQSTMIVLWICGLALQIGLLVLAIKTLTSG